MTDPTEGMTREEAYAYYGEGGTQDHLDEPDDEEVGLTVREARASRQMEAATGNRLHEIRSQIFKALVPEGGPSRRYPIDTGRTT